MYLLHVNVDKQNNIYFELKEQRNQFFFESEELLREEIKTNYKLFNREYITVEFPFEKVEQYNYCVNIEEGRPYFYFITDIKKINNNTSRIYIELDYYQTYIFDVKIKNCYVEREHRNRYILRNGEKIPVIDKIVEPFSFPQTTKTHDIALKDIEVDADISLIYAFVYTNERQNGKAKETYFTLQTLPFNTFIGPINYDKSNNIVMSFQYSGQFEFFSWESKKIFNFSDKGTTLKMFCLPYFPKNVIGLNKQYLPNGSFTLQFRPWGERQELFNKNDFYHRIDTMQDYYINLTRVQKKDLMRTDLDPKCYMSCFAKMTISNGGSTIANYDMEFLPDEIRPLYAAKLGYEIYQKCYIKEYKGDVDGEEYGAKVNNPIELLQMNDPYYAYQRQKKVEFFSGIFSKAASIGVGAITSVVNPVAGGIALSAAITDTARNTIDTFLQGQIMKSMPTQITSQGNETDIANNQVYFALKIWQTEYIDVINKAFKIYGYATNTFKVPKFGTRQKFNYYKLSKMHILGNVTSEVKNRIAELFYAGMWLWKKEAYSQIFDYEIENNEVELLEG